MFTFSNRVVLSSATRLTVSRQWRRCVSTGVHAEREPVNPVKEHTENVSVKTEQNPNPGVQHVYEMSNVTKSHGDPLIRNSLKVTNVCPEDQRSLKAAIIGIPNTGKSTLVNQFLGLKVFAVSPKRHTTLHKAMGVFTEGHSQVVLLDTPGLIPYQEGRKLNVTKQFLTDPSRSLIEADLVMVMVDVSNKRTRERLDTTVVKILRENSHIPSVLLLNKVDLLSHKHVLLSITEGLTGTLESKEKQSQIAALTIKLRNPTLPEKVRSKFHSIIKQLRSEIELSNSSCRQPSVKYGLVSNGISPSLTPVAMGNKKPSVVSSDEFMSAHFNYKEELNDASHESWTSYRHTHSWPHFKETFMISSLTGDGVESLKSYLVSCAKPSQWQYSPCELTDQSSLSLVEDIVREKLFIHLQKEIPYVITQENVLWEFNEDNVLVIYQNINCKSPSQASIVIGPMGKTIQAITAEATKDIERLLNCTIALTLNVRSKNKR